MPLLKRKAFEKSTASEYLRDDDEVFHCEITDEIFKDYEEYCQRIILVNSMVWTCEMTGKNNLTYAEALDSEKNARKSLKDFPIELRIPILYLAAKTKRSSFAEMSEDVFNFVRERFFIGETVEACLEGDVWQEAHVLSVTVQKQQPGSKATIPATSYIYEVEQYDESESDSAGQVCTAPHDRVRRRKGVYTRDKNRLFLKQHVELNNCIVVIKSPELEKYEWHSAGQVCTAPHDRVRRRKGVYTRDKNRLFLKQHVELNNGIVVIKKAALDKYSIHKTSFDQIFTGNPPEFSPSKKLLVKANASPAASKGQAKPGSASKAKKKQTPDKKGQTSMDKFVKKQDKTEVQKKPADPAAKKSAQELAEKMRRAEDQMRQRKEEEKAKKKEKNARLQAYIKEWQKVKDDLELEDHKVIPKGTPIDIEGVPHKHFGDFLSVLEFVYVYADILKTKDVFHNELDVESFRKALTIKEHAGVFSDLVQMFLTTIFSLQEDEAEDYNEKGGIQESTGDMELDSDTVGVPKAVELATKASKWSQTYLGTPLSKLPLDPTTVSEVLRLHLLSSGSAGGSRCATWRYQQRGGYSSHDDPGLRLRVTRPALIARLATTHIASLPLEDKFQLLQCLMNQILSYATLRDVIEEKLEELKNTKYQLRTLQINERKREAQVTVARQELKKQFAAKKEELKLTGDKAKALEEEHKAAVEKLAKESEEKKAEFERKAKELQVQVFDYASYVGTDRAYRRYWLNQRVAGLFVEAGDENRGTCRDKPLPPAPIHNGDTIAYVTELFHRGERDKPLPPAPIHNGDTIAYVTELFHRGERAGSDKENDSGANSRGNSPKKPLTSVNGLAQKLNGLENDNIQKELMACSGDITTCFVHGKADRPQWEVFHTEEQIEALIQSLNKRGLRESELRQALELDKDNILEYVKKCPVHMLNPKLVPSEEQIEALIQSLNKRGLRESELRQALELDKDNILEYVKKCPVHMLNPKLVPPPPQHHSTRNRKFQPSLLVQPEYTIAEALELSLRDHILELEEKVFHGCLGVLQVKDREAWRGTIMVRGYDKQVEYLTWGPNRQYRDDYHLPNGVLNVPEDKKSEIESIPQNKYRDPGHYLEAPKVNGVKSEGSGEKPSVDDPAVVRGLASALLQVSQGIHHKYIKRPLGLDEKERKEREAKNKALDLEALERWEVSLMECRSLAAIVLHLFTLDSSVCWSASILNASCRLCRRKTDPDNMLLCDGCNKGHHLYCLKPKLSKVPEGDWFCDQCKPKERTPRKRRKLFSDEDIEDALNSDEESFSIDNELCGTCGSGGRLAATCVSCHTKFHPECCSPPLTRAARRWTCHACLHPARETRRCAATALTNIHQYTMALETTVDDDFESDESDDNTALVNFRVTKSRSSKDSSPMPNGSAKRGRKPKDEKNTSSRKSKNSLTNGVHEEKSAKKRSSRQVEPDVKLHTEALDILLRDAMRHKDCWPFYEPVNVEEVPDYLDVITTPMDFSTMRQKLESGQYSADEELMADAALVLANCYTYNKDTHPVARAGVRLERYINKRCAELDLPPMPEIALDGASASGDTDSLKRRASPVYEEDAPRTKKPKLK